MRLKSWLIAINTALMAVVFAGAKEGSAFNYDRTTTFTPKRRATMDYVPLVLPPPGSNEQMFGAK